MDDIRKRLVALGINGLNKKILDEEKMKYFCNVRDSFIHRLSCLVLAKNYLTRMMAEVEKHINKDENLIMPTNESIALMNSLSLDTTYHLENFVFHLISSLDHIKDIVALFYKDINRAGSLRKTLYAQVVKNSQGRFDNKKILEFTKKDDYNWLITSCGKKGFYQYRANIYHHLSKLCDIKLKWKFDRDEGASSSANVGIPKTLWEIRKDLSSADILFFVNQIIKDYEIYLLDLIDSIESDNRL